MTRYFIHNLETDKLNIFTGGKADWLTIPGADRDRIKNACLWSRSINGWVSRCKGGLARFYASEVLERNGFENRGTEGERLTFTERIEAEQERASDRAERMEDRAQSAAEKSDSLYSRAHTMAEAIPFGQPILVGHYSESRDRRFREKIRNTFGRAFEEGDKAKYYARRAENARATADGSKYRDPAYLGNRIKEAKADISVWENRLQGKFYHYSTPEPITDAQRDHYETQLDEATERLEFFEHCMSECPNVFTRETLRDKQAVKVRGRWEPIVKLNPSTVAVPNTCYPLPEHQRKYALKYAYTEVQEAR